MRCNRIVSPFYLPVIVKTFVRACCHNGFKPILENPVFAVLEPFYPVNEAKTSNQFPLEKTSTKIFQIFCAISVHKKAAKNHPS